MLRWNRGLLPVLALAMSLSSCETCDECCADGAVSVGGVVVATGEAPSRLEFLRTAGAPVSLHAAWAHDYCSGCVVDAAWASGADILLEAFNPETRNYEIHSIDAKSGTPNWMLVLGANKLRVAPRPGDRYVAFLTENDGGIITVNRRTGSRERRVRSILSVATASPAPSTDTTVFVTSLGLNHVAALDPADARIGWSFPAPAAISAGPVVTPRIPRHLTVVGCLDGEVVAIPSAGWNDIPPTQPAWTKTLLGPVIGDLAVGETTDGARHVVAVIAPCQDRGLYCLDAANGETRWVVRTESAFGGQPAVMGGTVFARNADRMVAVDLATGDRRWPSSDPAAEPAGWELAGSALACDSNRAYLVGPDGAILRVDGKTGRILESAHLSAFDMVTPAGDANLLVCVTRDGYVVAFK